MIDHILLDVISALKGALEGALLERFAAEERFETDVFVGDITFATSYGLPGETLPNRVHVEITLEWSTWSQSTYRSWSIGEATSDRPDIGVEVAFRLDDLVAAPDPSEVLDAVGRGELRLSGDTLGRHPILIERRIGLDSESTALEISFGGTWHLVDALLEDPAAIETELGAMVRFIATALVRLADLDLPTVGTNRAPPSA